MALAGLTLVAVVQAASPADAATRRTRKAVTTRKKAAPRPLVPVTPVPGPVAPGTLLLAEDFERTPAGVWADGSVHGQWLSVYNGYGVNLVDAHHPMGQVLTLSPQPSTSPGETHAGLAVSTNKFSGDIDYTVQLKTSRQLRTPTPNQWEVAWVVWNYQDDGQFYYAAAKPNGLEIGKVDKTVVVTNPAKPANCVWPSYNNCKYEGGQRYLTTTTTPYPAGPWYTLRITQRGGSGDVFVNGALAGSFADDAPFTSGRVGLYTEDATVHFDNIRVVKL